MFDDLGGWHGHFLDCVAFQTIVLTVRYTTVFLQTGSETAEAR
jgi:hypothetical protein